jgi:hypothetical protein
MQGNHHKYIRIPALHKAKEEGDDQFVKRKIFQENSRSGRSVSRSETPAKSLVSFGQKHRSRRSRSCSSSRQAQPVNSNCPIRSRSRRIKQAQPRSEDSPKGGRRSKQLRPRSESSQMASKSRRSKQAEPSSEDSLTESSYSSSSNDSNINSQPQKSSSNGNSNVRRVLSMHTSAPSDQSSRSKSRNIKQSSKHSSRNTQRSSSNHQLKRVQSMNTSTPSKSDTIRSRGDAIRSNHSNFDGCKRVSWKSDPRGSFSDWTLHVFYHDSKGKRCIDVYHLHRSVVAYGNRKSSYLLRDIMEVEFQEHLDLDNKTEVELQVLIDSDKKNSSGKTTRLKLLNELQAQAVPIVLDFMYYTSETNQRMSADRSANVFKVAEGLQVRGLQTTINDFFAINISKKNVNEFLKAATDAKADMLLAICKAKIREMIAAEPELSEMIKKGSWPIFWTVLLVVGHRNNLPQGSVMTSHQTVAILTGFLNKGFNFLVQRLVHSTSTYINAVYT